MSPTLFHGERRKWWTLGAVSFGLFMIMLDNTVVNVALPSIQRDLGVGLSELEWVVTGYALTFAALMLIGGKLADMFGRRLLFVVGMALFTLASLWCGLADSGSMLIAARIAQGIGASLMSPASLSIITATFPPRQRGTAIGVWAGVSAMALAIGPLVGGLLTDHLSWHWIFFVNIPVGIAGIVASFLLIDESRDTSVEQRLDLPGLVTSALGLFALTYGLIEANAYGWTSARILAAFAIALVSLVAFVLLERHQRVPMLDLSLFRSPTYVGANVVLLLVALAMFGVFFFISLYMQNILGYSAVQAGAAFLPMTLLIIVIAPLAGRSADRIGSRALMTVGMTLVGIQLILFSRLDETASFWNLLPCLVIGGTGMAITMTPATAAAMKSVPANKAGVGSAVLNAFRQVGGSLGIALIGAIMAAEAGGRVSVAAFLDGLHTALLVAAGVAFLGAVVAFVLVRGSARTSAAAEVEPGRKGGMTPRLSAEARRESLVAAALQCFATTSYGGATTAELARAAGVSEPILYRHFASKRDLWFACLDAAWDDLRGLIEEKVALHASGVEIPEAEMRSPWESPQLPNLWLQGVTEAGVNRSIRDRVREHMHEVHGFVAELFREQQRVGLMPADRDPDAEAWIFVAGGLLRSVADRLGGIMAPEDLAAIGRQRRRWLSGRES